MSLLPLGTQSAVTALPVRPWPDPVIDALGHDPRSTYVEMFWLGILGPSTTWLLRRLAAGLDASPAGFDLDLADAAAALGLGSRGGRHSPFMRALGRCCQFDLAVARPDGTLAVRRRVPPLNRRQVLRLPPTLVAAHQAWQEGELRTPAAEQQRRRARRLALSLLELGEDVDATERQLLRWKFHPGLCRESAAWAWDRHRRALAGHDIASEEAAEDGFSPGADLSGPDLSGAGQSGTGLSRAGQAGTGPSGNGLSGNGLSVNGDSLSGNGMSDSGSWSQPADAAPSTSDRVALGVGYGGTRDRSDRGPDAA